MPLWPVQLPTWPGSNFTRLDPLEVLVDYDGPIAFTFKDAIGALMLAHSVGADGNIQRFLVAPTSPSIVERLKSGAISVRTALDQPILWLVDLTAQGGIAGQWAGTLMGIPSEAVPAEGVMLLPSLEPMLRLRAIGEGIEPGLTPAQVVRSLIAGAENAVRKLTNWVAGSGDMSRRPAADLRQLYQLRAQEFAFRSFEVGFRPVDGGSGRLADDPEGAAIIEKVQGLLTRGLRWAQTAEPPSEDAGEAQVIFEAMMELSPRQGSPVSAVEVGGRVAEALTDAKATLTKTTRQLANEAIGRIRRDLPRPRYAIVAGRVGAVDRDLGTAIIRAAGPEPAEATFRFGAEFLDAVLDALAAQYDVAAIGQPGEGHGPPNLTALERLDEPPAGALEEPGSRR